MSAGSATCTLIKGRAPLLISLPHDGTEIPGELRSRMSVDALRVPDTDWHVGRLYEIARDLGASILRPHYSRYVIDLNRPPDGAALYPGQSETGLVPVLSFAGQAIYREGQEPAADEVADRIEGYWRPYHHALTAELTRLQSTHGRVVLWDGHSIKSEVSMFFEGRLPDFNLGTANGSSCRAGLQQALAQVLSSQKRYSQVVNGRFKGGYITRHYGRPDDGIDAVQLELAQRIYMDEQRFVYDEAKAPAVQTLIAALLRECLASMN